MGGFPSLDQLFISGIFVVVTGLFAMIPVRSPIISPLASSNNSIHITKKMKTKNQQTPAKPAPLQVSFTVQQNETESMQSTTAIQPEAASQTSKNFLLQTTTITPAVSSETTPAPATAPAGSHTITAKTTITAGGKTIHLAMSFPGSGGAISGSMSGDCRGTISGKFDGPVTGNLNGMVNATCPEGFLSIPVSISYTGKMAPGDTQAAIHYTVTTLGRNESGNTTLTL